MSEPHQKEKHPNEPSSSSHIVEGVREVVYSAIDQALHHGAAHLMEHEGKALLKVLKEPFSEPPCFDLIRPGGGDMRRGSKLPAKYLGQERSG